MKAVFINDYGGAEAMQVGEQPTPTPGPNEVLVAVHAASINPIDWKIRAGLLRQVFEIPFPYILGRDFSGVVAAVGAEVKDTAPGDEVFGMANATRGGSHAEFVVVEKAFFARKPRGLSHDQAASLPLAGLSAMIPLENVAGLRGGQRVLIHAGAGGVGGFAVQLARHRGAWVAATCGPNNVDYVRGLGADRVIDYTRQDFATLLKGIDVVFDTVGGDVTRRSAGVLRSGGALVRLSAAPITETPTRADITNKAPMIEPRRELFERIAGLVESGAIKPQIGPVLALADAARGYELSRTGHQRGKIVLHVA